MSDIMEQRSIKGFFWKQSSFDQILFDDLVSRKVSRLKAYLFAHWGISSSDISDFENPDLLKTIPPSSMFLDMEKSFERLYEAIAQKQNVRIWGDYDVDGACSTSLLFRAFKSLGIQSDFYIPDRQKEGYGPNIAGFDRMVEDGIDLCILVDTGTIAFDVLDYAYEKNIDVIVIDHHTAQSRLPKSIGVINPNRLDSPKGSPGYLCAAGVVFCFLYYFWQFLKEKNYSVPKISSSHWVGLAGLATVSDVVPMIKFNRALVTGALRALSRRDCVLGMLALADISKVSCESGAKTVFGFGLGPRINAAGRIDDAMSGVRLLTSDDEVFCKTMSQNLDTINATRKDIEHAARKDALDFVSKYQSDVDKPIIVGSDDWHEGVVGIVAGRLKETFRKPSLVFGSGVGGVWKGSARSVPGFDIGVFAVECVQKGLALKGGGHPMAAGMTIEPEKFTQLRDYFYKCFENSDLARGSFLEWDIEVQPQYVSIPLVQALESFDPFGPGVEEPVVLIRNVYVKSHRLLGSDFEKQIRKIVFHDELGQNSFDGIIFKANEDSLGVDKIWNSKGKYDIVCRLSLNVWNDTVNVQALIQDVRVSS